MVDRERSGRDIARVEDLASGREAVISELPPELHGFKWEMDPRDGRIVSSYYGHRYEVNFQDRRTAAAGRFHETRGIPADGAARSSP